MSGTISLGGRVSRGWLAVAAVACAVAGLAASAAVRSSAAGVGSIGGSPAQRLPLAARLPVSAALGADDRAYSVIGLHAANPAQRLRAGFSMHGVSVSLGSLYLHFALTGLGRAGTLDPVPATTPRAAGNVVSYVHTGVVERWTNGPLGLEQTFTISRRPSGAGSLELAVGRLGAGVRAQIAGGSVLLTGAHAALRYGGLTVTDARGRMLPASLSVSGSRILINVDDRGAAYPLRIDPVVQQATLAAADGATGDFFGSSVAVDGSTLVVGAPYHAGTGAVYVFTEGSEGWSNATQVAELTPSDGAADDLGSSVAIQGSTIVAGAITQEANGVADDGAVYVFTEPPGGWVSEHETAQLTASDPEFGDFLGDSVAIDGSTIVAGAPEHTSGSAQYDGAVYVFTEPGGGWADESQTAELTESAPTKDDALGQSVAISGSTIVAGAPNANVNGDAGAVYVYTEPGGGWANATETAKLTASDGQTTDELGQSVAISGSTVVAGARYHLANGAEDAGAVYVWVEPGAGWSSTTQTAELTSSSPTGGGQLGTSVAIAGSTVVAGAPYANVGANYEQGAAYAWNEPTTGWTNAISGAAFEASNGAEEDYFGQSLALGGATLVAGAPQPGGLVGAGAGYVDVLNAAALTNVRAARIFGSAAPGHRLLAAHGRWSVTAGVQYTYQWFLCTGAAEQGCQPLSGNAGLISPRLSSGDAGDYITVVVGATLPTGGFGTTYASKLVS